MSDKTKAELIRDNVYLRIENRKLIIENRKLKGENPGILKKIKTYIHEVTR